jgi:polyphosphate kinase
MNSNRYFDRDLSWLSFNYRVLMEAQDNSVPLYERIKFLAIYSSNLDEFFRVRVASLQSMSKIKQQKIEEELNIDPKVLLVKINDTIEEQLDAFGKIFTNIKKELEAHNIYLYQTKPTSVKHLEAIKKYFKSRVLAFLQPVLLKEDQPLPFLDNNALYFAVELEYDSEDKNGKKRPELAILNIPSGPLPRFISLPRLQEKYHYMFLDDVIRHNIKMIFPGFKVKGCYSFKVNRDADLNLDDEFSGNLVEKIKANLDKRRTGEPTRLLYDQKMPLYLIQYFMDKLELEEEEILEGGRYHNFNDFFSFPNPKGVELEYPPFKSIEHDELDDKESFFDALDKKDYMLHFPYQSYDNVLRFFNEAAIDPDVVHIRLTVYRIAANSHIANAMISAAKNGKKVTCFVEVKARFDEANNIKWAEEMRQAGVDIIYSIPNLKVHAKVALVSRIKKGEKTRYAFFGTGNFNEKTSKIYADHGLFTSNETMTTELDQVFNFLISQSEKPMLNELLVAQVNMVSRLTELIDREIENAKAGKKAEMIIKLNNIEDPIMIDKLYEASQAGVKIELIARSICRVKPGIKGMSENITIRRIVDRFLEHARIYCFYNNGKPDLYMGSADWMERNLHRRVEVLFPVYGESIRQQVLKLLKFQLSDNEKAHYINQSLENIPVQNDKKATRSQMKFYKWIDKNMHLFAEEA